MTELRTERLVLRPFRAEDLAAFTDYRREPEVARYQSWDTTYDAADAERFFAEQQATTFGEPGAWLQLAAVEQGTGALVGDCAVKMVAGQRDTAEVGVTLSPARQGAGYASEALGAVLAWLFGEHGVHRVVAETDDRNAAVHRLLERLGFRCEGVLVEADWFKDEWCSLRLFALLRREWAPGGAHPSSSSPLSSA